MATADFDGDGVQELVVASADGGERGDLGAYLAVFSRRGGARGPFGVHEESVFTLNRGGNLWWMPERGWWHPRVTALDFDGDGDPDLLAGWGGGNSQRQLGTKLYLYRTPGRR
jgi:hypothetical protein